MTWLRRSIQKSLSTQASILEAVMLASRESRRLNQSRLNADLPDGVEKITTVSLARIADGKIEITRESSEGSESEDSEESTS